ncbi:hypothetical protein E2C01_073940 [Portunus trituberculatus]|uniref:Uncharacterized protein n=1 Tax=Portunus trituberculatus TaxID=210409 RepID=A0A5B7IFF3_PORTR|nr:hypothetical protein [Portunus trituberculatus]
MTPYGTNLSRSWTTPPRRVTTPTRQTRTYRWGGALVWCGVVWCGGM